jgi:hypothetical protein
VKPPRIFGAYEHHTQPLLPSRLFYRRLSRHVLLTLSIIVGSLAIGILGYRLTEGMPWLDAFLNASMILGGMGPVDTLRTDGGKLFAGLYALFSGLVVLVAAGILLAPIAHRILHRMHMPLEDEAKKPR